MPPSSERSRELIQRYVDELASEAELVELEALLTADPQVADAFSQAMRLKASLKAHFQKQLKIDQIARLLASETRESAPGKKLDAENSAIAATTAISAASTAPAGSIFVPGRGLPREPRRTRRGRPFVPLHGAYGRKSRMAVAVLLLAIGAAIWFSMSGGGANQPRVVAGRIAVEARVAHTIPMETMFEVASRESAVIELPNGIRIELASSTQAVLQRDGGRDVVKLVTGGGDFLVPAKPGGLRIETPLGLVVATDSRFSLELQTPSAAPFSSTNPIRTPQLTVIVASGSVTIKRGGVTTTLSAGDERTFL